MQRPPGSTVDEATGLDICRRENIPALISGVVARSGATTHITIKVLDAGGALLFVENAEYTKPDQLFGRVDDLAARVRGSFGESESGIARSSQPLQKVTTGSFDALRQYSLAVEARAKGDFNAVEGPLLAALQLDPGFAMALLKLGDYYMDVAGDDQKALVRIDKAYALRDRVTDRERLFIAAQYFSAHQQFEEARDSLKALTAIYPDDPDFRYQLAIAFYALEQLPPATNELRQAIRFNPHDARAHGSLVLFLARDNQPGAALDAFAEARNAGVGSSYLHWAGGLAHLARGEIDLARSNFDALSRGGGYFALLGRLQQARVLLFEDRLDVAIEQLKEFAALARREGDVNLEVVGRCHLGRAGVLRGDTGLAQQQALIVAGLTSGSRPTQLRDAASLAIAAGIPAVADQQLARLRQLESAAPTPLLRAARLFVEGVLALRDRRLAVALKCFDDSYVLRPWYECRRHAAEASEGLERWNQAADVWRSVLGVRGQIIQDGFTPDLRLAETRLARALARIRKD